MRSMLRVVLVAASLAAGCHHGDDSSSGEVNQAYRDSVQAICDAPSHVPDDGQPAVVRLSELTAWLDRHVKDSSLRKLGQGLEQGDQKAALSEAVARAGLKKCVLLENDMALQSYHDAMQVFCDMPKKVANRTDAQRYMESHLLNPGAVRFFSSLGEADPATRVEKLRSEAAKVGVTSCPMADQMKNEPTPAPEPATLPSPGAAAAAPVTQAYRDSVQAICDAPAHAPAGKPWQERLKAVSAWVDQHVTDPSVRSLGAFDKSANAAALADAVKRAGIQKCALLDNGMALQSYHDAMQVICDSSLKAKTMDDRARYLRGNLLNPEAIRVFAAMGEVDPAQRRSVLQAAVTKAGIDHCAVMDEVAAPPAPKAP